MRLLVILTACLIFSVSYATIETEKLTFSLQYGLIKAGTANLQIKKIDYLHKNKTVEAYQISSSARSNDFFDALYKVRDKIVSIWDFKHKVSLEFSKELNEGSYHQKRVHYYYPSENISLYKSYDFKASKYKEKTISILDNTQDILTSFYLTRDQDLEKLYKSKENFYINVTADGDNYKGKAIIKGKKKIRSPLFKKKVNCYVVVPIMANNALFKNEGKITIYLTADEKKTPLLLESKFIFGHFKAVLRKIEYNVQ